MQRKWLAAYGKGQALAVGAMLATLHAQAPLPRAQVQSQRCDENRVCLSGRDETSAVVDDDR